MAKTKVSELTRELVAKATSLIGSATAAQKKVQERTLELKKKENDLRRRQEDQRKQQEREESRRQQKEAANMSGISADDLAKFAKAAEAAEARNAEIKAEEARQKAEAEAKAKQEAEQKAARPVQPSRPERRDDRRFDDRRSDDRRPDDRRFGRPAGTQQQGQGMQQNGERRFGRPVPGKEYQQQGQGMQQNGERRFGRPAGMQQGGPRPSAPMMNKDKDSDYDNKNDHRGGNKNGKSGFQRKSSGAGELIATVEKEKVSNYDPNKKLYEQRHDQEHTPAKPAKPGNASKQSARSSGAHGIGMDTEEDFVRRKAKKSKQQMPAAKPEPVRIEKAVMTSETITVKDLSEKIGKASAEIIKKLIILGTMANINAELDLDTAQLVCSEFGIELEYKPEKTAEDALDEENFTDKEEDLIIRNPVVTIMGHVDHGKTSLLDHIRNAHVTAGEAGGITQHIGAYTVNMNGQGITFLDTPGHEAFTAMRARGAMATDIAVLVVAADDGVMPQTIESINHAKAANVPVIVAINKCDKPTANPERIRQQLTEYNLVAEEWGGDTMMVEVSAHTGMGVDQLLESILILSEVQELKANPNRKARGIIIEAKLDKGRGPVATVLVQNGTLKIGDTIVAGTAFGRVRAMVNDRGERVKTAGPSMPVEVIGFNDVPSAGDIISAVDDDKLSRQVAEERKDKLRAALIKTQQKTSLDDLFNQISEGQIKDLNIIVKADVQGSVEAVKQSLEKLTNEEVRVRCIHGGVGAITETDVMLAAASSAIIIGFNVRHDNIVRDLAEKESVEIRLYRVIYNAIEDVQAAMKGMLAPKFKEVIIGRAEVRQIYHVSGVGTVAGCYVTDGKLARNCSVRLLRDNIVITETKLGSLKRFKDDAKEVATGYECGCGLEGYNDVKEGDIFECFQMEEIKQ